jgi:hypothetical protein
MRAMGGRTEEKNPDGSVTIKFLARSDKMMDLAMKYLVGAPPTVIEMNPDAERPANVRHTVDKEVLKGALAELNEEY